MTDVYIHPAHAVLRLVDWRQYPTDGLQFFEYMSAFSTVDQLAIYSYINGELKILNPLTTDCELKQERFCRRFQKRCLEKFEEDTELFARLLRRTVNAIYWDATDRYHAEGVLLNSHESACHAMCVMLSNESNSESDERMRLLIRYFYFCDRVVAPLLGYC